jgi:anti-sigma regulatory factor (Ser/Thr protein kinase)
MSVRLIRGSTPLRLEVREQTDIGECRRIAQKLAQAHGFDEEQTGKISIVATELSTNLVRHGGGGEMLLQVLEDGAAPQFEMMAIDRGAGMRDMAQCLRDGYSTSGTAGTGLGAASRLSTEFDLFSESNKGTVVLSRVTQRLNAVSRSSPAIPPASAGHLEFGALCVPLAGESECGDCWRIADDGARVSLLVADGLGHGALAASASRSAAEAFEEGPFDDAVSVLQSVHRHAAGGRGTVAACAQLHPAGEKLAYAGVGNISGTIVDRGRSRGMVSVNGTLGTQLPRSRQFDYDYRADAVVVLHSDGLSGRWQLADHPGLHLRHASVIAGVLFRDCARKHDDATVLVARHRP